jgi:hypothetical protein
VGASGTLIACGGSDAPSRPQTSDQAAIEARIARERVDAAAQAKQSERIKQLQRKVDELEKSGKATKTTTVIERRTSGAVPAAGDAQTAVSGGWPSGTSGWTVVLESKDSPAGARQAAEQAVAAGLPDVGVLNSSEHSSLRPGWWVAYTGLLDKAGATQRQADARAAGFGEAYARYVSAG